MLTRLEQEGYIQRKQDWKTKWITLTSKGEDKMLEDLNTNLLSKRPLSMSA
jgi:DNA-binding MarR family transcriptional regulator